MPWNWQNPEYGDRGPGMLLAQAQMCRAGRRMGTGGQAGAVARLGAVLVSQVTGLRCDRDLGMRYHEAPGEGPGAIEEAGCLIRHKAPVYSPMIWSRGSIRSCRILPTLIPYFVGR